MVTPRDPEGDLPSHSVPTGDGVLHAVGQGMAQVKFSRHIWRRDDHHEDILRGNVLDPVLPAIFRFEKSLFLPPGIPSSLNILGAVGVRENIAGILLLSGFGIS